MAFLAIMGLGVLIRLVTMVAYRPALFFPDSADYLNQAHHLSPVNWHPLGYPIFLAALVHLHAAWIVAGTQHLLGLAMALGLYVLAVHLGVRPWLAAVAIIPVTLDPAQIALEHYVLSETLFEAVIVAALIVMLWRRVAPVWIAGLVGVLCAYGAWIRFTGLILFLPFTAYFVAIKVGWRRLLTFTLCFALPVVAYASWYDAVWGTFQTSNLQPYFLYSRTAPIANCASIHLAAQKALCPTLPIAQRPEAGWYTGSTSSPAFKLLQTDPVHAEHIISGFNRAVIIHQPLDVVWHAAIDALRPFGFQRDSTGSEYQVATRLLDHFPDVGVDRAALIHEMGGQGSGSIDHPLASFLLTYQRFAQVPGPLLACALLLSLVAILGVGRARSSGRRAEVFALAATPLALLGFSVINSYYVWRYSIPVLILLPVAGAVGLAILFPATCGDGAPPRHRRPSRQLGEGEDLRPVVGHTDGVLEVGRE